MTDIAPESLALAFVRKDRDERQQDLKVATPAAEEFAQRVVQYALGRSVTFLGTAEAIASELGADITEVSAAIADINSEPDFLIQAKAKILSGAYERTYKTCRIYTDIRPVFSESETGFDPQLFFVSHTLQFTAHEGDLDTDYWIHLDPNDVDDLIRVLQRAKAKRLALDNPTDDQ